MYKVLAYVPDQELADRLNEAVQMGYEIKQMWRNAPYAGGVENTTVLMKQRVYKAYKYRNIPSEDGTWPQTIEVPSDGTAPSV